MTAQFLGDIREGMPTSRKGSYKVSFFLGEVLVAQRCIPFLGRGRMLVLSHLFLFWARSLHLLVESVSANNCFNLTQCHVMIPAKYGHRNHARTFRRLSVCSMDPAGGGKTSRFD